MGTHADDRPARRAAAEPVGGGRWELTLTIAEGRNREIRRLCAAVGLDVDRLVRVAFGPVNLGDLEPGAIRELSPRERDIIDAIAGRPAP